jgi:hypothetical protein
MNEKTIVLTMYGTGEAIDNVTVTLFDTDSQADVHCFNINELVLKDGNWIYSSIVNENEKIILKKPIRCDFDILCSLDDYAIQKVIREIDYFVLPSALISADKNILSAILRNMSKRAAKMLIEEMEYMHLIQHEDIQKARKKIVNLIQELEMFGEIIVPKFNQNEK